jgi:hypothetical protein
MDSAKNKKTDGSPNLEISLLGERFRLRPSRISDPNGEVAGTADSHLAREAIEWANRQILAAEKRLKDSPSVSPRAHHVALLALVELAHEALSERSRTADSLKGLIERLEKLKALRANSAQPLPNELSGAASDSRPTSSIDSVEANWLEDQPTGASALVPPA